MEDKKLSSFTGRDFTRQKVRIRDKLTCQRCGKKWLPTMRRFDVHHLKGLCGKKSKAYDKSKDMKILITYCHRCHLTLHSVREKMRIGQFGRGYSEKFKLRNSHIRLLRKQGLTLQYIADKKGISHERVRQICLNKR